MSKEADRRSLRGLLEEEPEETTLYCGACGYGQTFWGSPIDLKGETYDCPRCGAWNVVPSPPEDLVPDGYPA